MTNAGLERLFEGCSTLQSLDLSGCDRVSDIGVLSQGCLMIKILDLARCKLITDIGLGCLSQIALYLRIAL